MKKTIFTFMLFAMAFFAKAQYPLVPIDSVQFMDSTRLAAVKFNVSGQDSTFANYIRPKFSNAKYGDTVVIEGIVTFDPASYGLSFSRRSAFIQEAGNRPWCGVEVMADTSVLNPRPTRAQLEAASQFEQNLKKGRKVRVTAWIGNFQGHTQLYLLPIPTQVISSGNTIAPQVIKLEDINKTIGGGTVPQFATGEKWESVLIEMKDVIVDNVAPGSTGRWVWSLKDINGNVISIRDYSGYYRNDNLDYDNNTPRNFTPPGIGTKLSYIRGVITESGSSSAQKQYFLAPLYPDDIGLPPAVPPVVSNIKRTPRVVTPTTMPTISATITDDSTVVSAILYYAVGYTSTTWQTVAMTNTGSTYSAQIPAQAAGSIVKFYIKATDNGGNYVNFPDSIALNSAYKVVNGITSIRDIQETPYSNGGSMFVNDTLTGISIPGVVVSTNASNDLGLFTIQAGTDPWSGIFVRPTIGDGVTNWKRGDSVVITDAVVTERFNAGSDPFGNKSATFGTTFLEAVKFTYAGRCKVMPVITNLPFDSVLSTTYPKEQFECMMVKYNNVYVINKNPDGPNSDFGEFLVNPNQNATAGLRGENYSNDLGFTFNKDSLTLKEQLPVFQGPMVFLFGNWKLLPRNRTDVGKRGDLIPPYIIKKGADTVYQPKNKTYVDTGATACDDMDGDISSSVQINTSNVDVTTAGTYIVNFNVKDAAQNPALPVIRTVIVQDNIGMDEFGKGITMGLYPVPVSNSLTLSLGTNYDGKGTVNILDISGKVVATRQVEFTAGNTNITIPTTEFTSGIYFCQFSSKYTHAVQKFVVVK